MRFLTSSILLLSALYLTQPTDAKIYYEERFDRDTFTDKWVVSDWKKSEGM